MCIAAEPAAAEAPQGPVWTRKEGGEGLQAQGDGRHSRGQIRQTGESVQNQQSKTKNVLSKYFRRRN